MEFPMEIFYSWHFWRASKYYFSIHFIIDLNAKGSFANYVGYKGRKLMNLWKGGSKGSCNIIYERHRQGSWIWIFTIHNLNLQALIKCLIKMTFKRSNKWNGSNFHNFLKISAYNHRIVSIIFNIFMYKSFVSF